MGSAIAVCERDSNPEINKARIYTPKVKYQLGGPTVPVGRRSRRSYSLGYGFAFLKEQV
jgi:hypothetical protein